MMYDYRIDENKALIRIKRTTQITSFIVFAIACVNVSFCTENQCRQSFESLLIGWLAILTGGAAISWLANPFLFISWFLVSKTSKYALFSSFVAVVLSVSFLFFDKIIEDEAGHYGKIVALKIGYWFWLTSCLLTFIGCIVIYWFKRRLQSLLPDD